MADDVERTLGGLLDRRETAAAVEKVAELSADQLKALNPAFRQRVETAFTKAEKSTADSPYEEGQIRHEQYTEQLKRLHAIDEVAKSAAKDVLSGKNIKGGEYVSHASMPAVRSQAAAAKQDKSLPPS
jgi:hypothetical protein